MRVRESQYKFDILSKNKENEHAELQYLKANIIDKEMKELEIYKEEMLSISNQYNQLLDDIAAINDDEGRDSRTDMPHLNQVKSQDQEFGGENESHK